MHLAYFSVITEIGRCAKAYCEHTARSVPTLSDTVVTLIEMGERRCKEAVTSSIRSTVHSDDFLSYVCINAGFNPDSLPVYAKRSQRMVITARESELSLWISALSHSESNQLKSNVIVDDSAHDCEHVSLYLCDCSSGDKPPRDTQSSGCWTETCAPGAHSQPFPRVPGSSHLHQDTSESHFPLFNTLYQKMTVCGWFSFHLIHL